MIKHYEQIIIERVIMSDRRTISYSYHQVLAVFLKGMKYLKTKEKKGNMEIKKPLIFLGMFNLNCIKAIAMLPLIS